MQFKRPTLPMVNVRVALEAARQRGIIRADEERALLQLLKDLYFPDRTWPMMFKLAADAQLLSPETTERLKHYLGHDAPDAKRDNALQLLDEVKRIGAML